MKLTLLEIIQDMLDAIDAEAVTSVGETEEAGMCVNLANRTFESIIIAKRWRHIRTYTSLSTTTNLNEMTTPTGTVALDPYNLYYNDALVEWLDPDEFLARTITRDTSESNITTINNVKVYIDRDPRYFTSDDDETLRFDAIPDNINGLVGADTLGLAFVAPTTRLSSDGEYFDLPAQMFPALDALCIANAVSELKGDSTEGQIKQRTARNMVAKLGRNARLVDIRNDIRKWIVPRRSLGTAVSHIQIA